MKRKFNGTKRELIARLKLLGIDIIDERNIAHANQLTTRCGAKINLYQTKTLLFQGQHGLEIERRWEEGEADSDE